tara:strand:+ start:377 stop:1171 length:795 start_codon:yes stop_codon:yes gene_type:complete
MLTIKDLRVQYRTSLGLVDGLKGLSLVCGKERLGVVGVSGSGKSSLGRAIMRLLPESAVITAKEMSFDGRDLLKGDNRSAASWRGQEVSMIFQDPHLALNPIMKIGSQITETYERHIGRGGQAARRYGLRLLESVHIADPSLMWNSYPRELSGGMAQRAMIALMLACNPQLLIADEPTSALDVLAREAVLEVLDELVETRGMGLLLISHDLGLVTKFCDRVVVIRDGEDIETLPASELVTSSCAYTRSLLAARPRLLKSVDGHN